MLYDIKEVDNKIYLALYAYDVDEYNILLQFNNSYPYFNKDIDIQELVKYLKKILVKSIDSPKFYNIEQDFFDAIDILVIECNSLEFKKNKMRKFDIFSTNEFYKR